MNLESANSLLKTLEEPPEYSMMILIADNVNSILPTILSRCQKIQFQPLSPEEISEIMIREEWVSGLEEAEPVAMMSQGSMTLARQLLDPELRNLREILFGQLISKPFNSVKTTKKIQDLLNDIGTDTTLQRENSRWVIRFTVEFFQYVSRLLVSDSSRTPVPEAKSFTSSQQSSKENFLSVVSEVIDYSGRIEQQLLQYSPSALCLEGYFNELGQKLKLISG